MNFLRALALAAIAGAAAHAFPVTESFSSPDTPAPAGGWGSDWKIEGEPVFLQGQVGKKQTDGQTIAINFAATLPDGEFRLSANVYAQANNRWIGLVFHYTATGDYIAWRVKFSDASAVDGAAWQLVEAKGGKISVIQEGTIAPGADLTDPAPLKAWRRLEVEREAGGRYVVRVQGDKSGTSGWSTPLTWKEGGAGLAGLTLSSGFVWIKDFAAE